VEEATKTEVKAEMIAREKEITEEAKEEATKMISKSKKETLGATAEFEVHFNLDSCVKSPLATAVVTSTIDHTGSIKLEHIRLTCKNAK